MGSDTGRKKALLLVVTIFAIGFLAGALTMNLYFTTAKGADPTRGGSSHETKRDLLDELTKELQLTSEQTQQIDAVLTETREEYLRLRKETRPHYQLIRSRSRDRIRQVLRADQLPKFEEMVRQRDEERKKLYEKESR